MVAMETYANRTFLPRILKDGTKRGIEHHYYSFAHDRRPVWWNSKIPSADRAFAVYENNLESSRQAIVFSEEQLVVLDDDHAAAVRFDEISRLILPTKTPVSLSLKVVLHSGTTVDLPFNNPVGIAFDMYRFLLSALGEVERRKKLTGGS